ncbi:MAG: PSD1 and planctomycete cytochrome C domain-containing protein [Akkermansiaceae bacterium]
MADTLFRCLLNHFTMRIVVRLSTFALAIIAVVSPACRKQTAEEIEASQVTDTASIDERSAIPDTVTFNAHIRPIFSNKCYACHGFDKNTREADLRLDTEEGAYAKLKESDKFAIVPGDPENSDVWQRITTADDEQVMPPVKFHKPLDATEKAMIKRWIEQGAKYENHWAYNPIKNPPVPTLEEHADFVANPIDHFILARLEAKGIAPAKVAGKRTLLRRLSLDLTGLPPTIDEMEVFLKDNSADAYEKQVNRLLASPRYGERMAVAWLDVARYSDTVGFHGDQNQHIFPYRDYVIKAFNDNKPFDKFTIEQLAGDLLENPSDEQRIATGFVRLSQMTREGGAQPGEYLAKYASDRVRAVGGAWLGQTTGCAECHDHKFDPITAKDFYALSAFFKDFKQWGVYTNYRYTPNPDLAGFNNEYPFPPEIVVKNNALMEKLKHLRRQAHRMNVERAKPSYSWEAETSEYLKKFPTGWATASAQVVTSRKNTSSTLLQDASVLLTGAAKKEDMITLEFAPEPGHLTALQMEVLPHAKNQGFHGRGKGGTFALVKPTFELVKAQQPEPSNLAIAWAQADFYLPEGYRSGYAPIAFPKIWRTGNLRWSLPNDFQKRKHAAVFILKSPITIAQGDRIRVMLKTSDLGRFRILTTRFGEAIAGQPAVVPELLTSLNTEAAKRSEAQKSLVKGTWSLAHLPSTQLDPSWPTLQKSIRNCRSGVAKSLIALTIPEKEIPVTRILPRGDWQNHSGEIVQPAVLHFLPQPKDAGKRRLTRLDLANWIVSDTNPLTARHVMNRYWKQFFGNGISNVLDDLGSQGEWPSHPDLLDWLAYEFRSNGWDTKKMIKLMVMSHTYRQESGTRSDLKDIDPYNRLLAGQSARRLDAEFIRDNGLAISGLLETDYTGGPSVFPYQPPGYYAPLQFPNRRYTQDTDGGEYRRGVYMHWQRTFLHPMLANFDAPSREECSADRLQSNSPLQALTLLNDPAAVGMAKAFAQRALSQQVSLDDRVSYVFQRALSRPPNKKEKESITKFYQTQLKHYRETPDDLKKLLVSVTPPKGAKPEEFAAWIQTCRVLLNLHETITRY